MRLLLALRKEKNKSENKNKTKISGLGRGMKRGQSCQPPALSRHHRRGSWAPGMLPEESAATQWLAAQGWGAGFVTSRF